MLSSSIHLSKPKRRSSLSVSLPSASAHSAADGNDSDSEVTEVTSNTNPSNPPRKSVTICTSSASGTESERWSSGDAVKPAKRGSIVPDHRRYSGSTCSTTSNGSSSSHIIGCKHQEESNDQEQDQVAVVSVGDCDSYDLKSKPGFINFQQDHVDDDNNMNNNDSDNFELLLGDDDDDNENGYVASSRSHHPHSNCGGETNTGSRRSSGTCSSFLLTQERVRAHMKDYYEDFDSIFRHGKSSEAIWDSFFKQYYTEDILWVRSSSNTLKGPELAHHFANDIVGIRMQLVSIDNIQILGGMTAVVVFTADQEFLYRGHPVSDRTVLTMVLHVDASRGHGQETIRIAHEHRCVGKPIPKNTRWGSGMEK